MDRISRTFLVKRGTRLLEYKFQTYTSIFMHSKMPVSANQTLQKYLCGLMLDGISATRRDRMSVTSAPPLIVRFKETESPLVELAKNSKYRYQMWNQHNFVQNYFLDNDPHTIATEVPVWNGRYIGHIDIIRIVDDIIEILDFKPEAHKEIKAPSQVRRYVSLLQERLNLPLYKFRAGYFDDTHFYTLTL